MAFSSKSSASCSPRSGRPSTVDGLSTVRKQEGMPASYKARDVGPARGLRLVCFCLVAVLVSLLLASRTDFARKHAWKGKGAVYDLGVSLAKGSWKHELHIEGKYTRVEDEYLCTAYPLPRSFQAVRAFDPTKTMPEDVHHMIVHTCESLPEVELLNEGELGKPPVWNCLTQSKCGPGRSKMIYAWAKGADGLEFEDGYGFSLHERTQDKYLVLESHFLNLDPSKPSGDASLRVSFDTRMPKKHLSIFLFGTGRIMIQPDTPRHVVSTGSCCMSGSEKVEVYAYRVHAHSWSRKISLVVGGQEVVSGDPQLPNFFTRTPEGSLLIDKEQPWSATCEYNTTGATKVVRVGHGHNNEMCNLYLMTASDQKGAGEGGCWAGSLHDMNMPVKMSSGVDWSSWRAEKKGLVGPPVFGQVGGMHTGFGEESHFMYIFHRADRMMGGKDHPLPVYSDTIVVWDMENRRQVRSFGSGLSHLAHGMTVDLKGNLWITDVDSQMVHKLDPHGRVLMKVGTKGQRGSGEYTFCRPTEVAVASDGRFFVSDGYCNSRVVEYSADGKFVREHPMTQGMVIHNVEFDECTGLLLVSNREAGKVYVYYPEHMQMVLAIDLWEWGQVYSITKDAYGNIHALTWRRDTDKKTFLVPMLDISGKDENVGIHLKGIKIPHDLHVSYNFGANALVAFVGETGPGPKGKITEFLIPL